MSWSISDLIPNWGDTGERPSDNFNYQGGDQVNEKHIDYLWASVGSLEDEVRSALQDIDSDQDGVVDQADDALLFKGNDIDSDGDGVVNSSDQLQDPTVHDVDQFDGSNGTAGQYPRTDGTNVSWVTVSFEGQIADDSGVVDSGDAANIFTTDLNDGETLEITEAALLLSDGQPAPSGVDLTIATLDNAGGGTNRQSILQGDGTTVFDDEEGAPLASYTNTSGSNQTVMIAVDNGHFNTGSGSAQDVHARAIEQVN